MFDSPIFHKNQFIEKWKRCKCDTCGERMLMQVGVNMCKKWGNIYEDEPCVVHVLRICFMETKEFMNCKNVIL